LQLGKRKRTRCGSWELKVDRDHEIVKLKTHTDYCCGDYHEGRKITTVWFDANNKARQIEVEK
jgi:hypothetical protein